MYICYMDESGCTGALPSSTSPIQPVLVVAGVIIDQQKIQAATVEYLNIKRKFFPKRLGQSAAFLQWVLEEIKGSDIRKDVRSSGRSERRHAIGFLDHFMLLLERNGVKIIGRLWVKGVGQPFSGTPVYTSSVQHICEYFNNFLESHQSAGCIIADSRNPALNANVSHSIFTMKFRAKGDAFPRILEMPTFGHSENHVGIQLVDLLCSSLLFPLAAYSYCTGHVTSVHVSPSYSAIKLRFGARLRSLQYIYRDGGKIRGGITVSDAIGKKSAAEMF